MPDKDKSYCEDDFDLVFDLEIVPRTPGERADHQAALDEMIRERNRLALADPDLDTDLPF